MLFPPGVIAQVDHVISKQEKDRGKKAAEKLLKSLEQEIRYSLEINQLMYNNCTDC